MNKMFIVSHKKMDHPINCEGYDYISVNRTSDVFMKYSDATGDNISIKNANFCELTALYWIWKNDDSKKVGLCHYRRFFIKKSIMGYQELSVNELDHLLQGYDLIVPKQRRFHVTNYEYYEQNHNIIDLNITRRIIEDVYPEYLESFDTVMGDNKLCCFNMFYGNKDIIDNYCEWLFSILFELEKTKKIEDYNQYQSRIFGFLSERLFNVWIIHNSLNCKEVSFINSEKMPISFFEFYKNKFMRKR